MPTHCRLSMQLALFKQHHSLIPMGSSHVLLLLMCMEVYRRLKGLWISCLTE